MRLADKYRLQDILFSGLNNKQCMDAFGPIIANTIVNFKLMEKCIQHTHNWHTHTPIWYNNDIRSGGAPFFSRDWMQKGITLKDISSSNCMLSFQELCERYGTEPSSLFLYLRLRSAMKAYGVPWGESLPMHPIIAWFDLSTSSHFPSWMYRKALEATTKRLAIQRTWERDCQQEDGVTDWERVWQNIFTSSKNPNHQMIHYNFCHRTYWTPLKRHRIDDSFSPFCDKCPDQQLGSFFHMMWECQKVKNFWSEVCNILSKMIDYPIPVNPSILLLSDDSLLNLSKLQRTVWLAGLTSAKKTVSATLASTT